MCILNDVAVTRRCKLFHPGYLEAAVKERKKKSSKPLIASDKVSDILIVDVSVADFDRSSNVYAPLAERTVLFPAK